MRVPILATSAAFAVVGLLGLAVMLPPDAAAYITCSQLTFPVRTSFLAYQGQGGNAGLAEYSLVVYTDEHEANPYTIVQARFGVSEENQTTGADETARFKLKVRPDSGTHAPAGATGGTYASGRRWGSIPDAHYYDVAAAKMNGRGQATPSTRTFVRLREKATGETKVCVAPANNLWWDWTIMPPGQQAIWDGPPSIWDTLLEEAGFNPPTADNEPVENITLPASGSATSLWVEPETTFKLVCPSGVSGYPVRTVVSSKEWRFHFDPLVGSNGPTVTLKLPISSQDPTAFGGGPAFGCNSTVRST